jgi:hypothetical protein
MELDLGYKYSDFSDEGLLTLAYLYAEISILNIINPERYRIYYILLYDNLFGKLSSKLIDSFNHSIELNKFSILSQLTQEDYNMSEILSGYVLCALKNS